MKMNFKYIFSAVVVSVMPTACIGDLDTTPLDDRTVTSESAYGADEAGYVQGLTKVYAQFASNNTKDLIVDDGGSSELIRTFWSTQEITTDACKVGWGNDSWAQDLNRNTWTAQHNHMIYSVYVRTLQGVAYANEYLRQTEDSRLELRGVSDDLKAKIAGFRAETRFLRAYFYWMALDTFGSVPFSTENSPFGGGYNPPQASRADIFNFCVEELEALAAEGSDMPAAQANYPRADKGSCLGLLARLYINGKVYTGTESNAAGKTWSQLAKDTCERIYGLGKYSICPDYAALFRGDNGENVQARNEFLFAVAYDGIKTKSYGGTTFLTLASTASDDCGKQPWRLNGVNGGWGGIRVPYEYVEKYFAPTDIDYTYDPGYATTTQELYTRNNGYKVADKRGSMFYILKREQSMKDHLYDFLYGWTCLKFNSVPHDKTIEEYASVAGTATNADVDFPMIRLGEIHLIYAEACMTAGGSAAEQIKALADRAGIKAETNVTIDWLVAERARELMWEGHRRTDLVRYGKYTSKDFLWPYKGGDDYAGKGLDATRNLFAIPATERASNPDLKQNPGYEE